MTNYVLIDNSNFAKYEIIEKRLSWFVGFTITALAGVESYYLSINNNVEGSPCGSIWPFVCVSCIINYIAVSVLLYFKHLFYLIFVFTCWLPTHMFGLVYIIRNGKFPMYKSTNNLHS